MTIKPPVDPLREALSCAQATVNRLCAIRNARAMALRETARQLAAAVREEAELVEKIGKEKYDERG